LTHARRSFVLWWRDGHDVGGVGRVADYIDGVLGGARAGRGEVVLLIESNPANLDPRFATDGQSQHLDGLILVRWFRATSR